MSRLHQLIASTAIGLGLALMATVASAVNPIINGNFKQLVPPGDDISKIVGWTFTPYVNPRRPVGGIATDTIFTANVYDTIPPVPGTTATHYGRFDCLFNCKSDRTQSISQLITGLEQNKTYTISFYIEGYAQGYTNASGVIYPAIPPFYVSLGSQTAPPILLPPTIPDPYSGGTVEAVYKKSVTFTYTDPGSSALLTFTQHMSGEYIPPRDVPLTMNVHSVDTIYLSMDGPGIVDTTPPAPVLSVQKALNGNRGANDQFTVQILQGSTVVNSTAKSTTTGSGSTVDIGTGTTGATTLTAGTSYKITEGGTGSTSLGGYGSTLACSNSTGTTVPTALNTAFTLSNTDTVSCTITNKVLPATLALRQLVQKPVPINIVAPYTFSYTGNNGWTTQPVTNDSQATLASSPTQTLSAFNTATTLSAIMPARWSVATFSCVDINAAASGNPPGELVKVLKLNTITIPAANVRPGANLRCTSMLSRLTP